ncbi:MAG: type IV pilus modification protein PilV [Gammaproteobacteria bacterium]|nr:MAG: type IV pilus modification protein PilV [Gammaproteobacteria bacterium]
MKLSHNYLVKQKGFMLIEAMIALMILSVGLLGIAGMQLLGLRMNYDAYQRTQVTALAYDIAEKMRLDSSNSLKAAGSNPYQGTVTKADTFAACDDSDSDPENLLECWQIFLRDQIPTGSIAISAPGDSNYPHLCPTTNELDIDELGIEVSWSDNWIGQGAVAAETSCQTFVFNVRNG